MPATSAQESATTPRILIQQIGDWLQERLAESGAQRFVLGLSGGIDSAVVCGLCTRAAGSDRVLGVILPSASHPDDAECARLVAETFRVRTVTVDLTGVADIFYRVMPTPDALRTTLDLGPGDLGHGAEQLAKANVRPRLRMTTLYYLANLCGGIVVGTGNKSEAAIGYFTKYGDGGVDLFPIIDLYKHEVRAVAQVLGVPQRVIERPPSAGLWQGQTDEGEIGLTYDELDQALVAIERGDTSNVEPRTLERVRALIQSSEHKRQAIPAFRQSDNPGPRP